MEIDTKPSTKDKLAYAKWHYYNVRKKKIQEARKNKPKRVNKTDDPEYFKKYYHAHKKTTRKVGRPRKYNTAEEIAEKKRKKREYDREYRKRRRPRRRIIKCT